MSFLYHSLIAVCVKFPLISDIRTGDRTQVNYIQACDRNILNLRYEEQRDSGTWITNPFL
jgi:hypothetical protein